MNTLDKKLNDIEIIARSAYEAIKNGGLALIPDGAGYGLVGNSKNSIQRIYELKGRPITKPLTHYMNVKYFSKFVDISKNDLALIKEIAALFPCCFIAPYKSDQYFEKLSNFALKQSTKNGTVAFYFDEEDMLVQKIISLAQKDRVALIVSSANLSGTGNKYDFKEVPQKIVNAVDIAIKDTRSCKYKKVATIKKGNPGATIVDICCRKILRRGIFSEEVSLLLEKYHDFGENCAN